MLSRLAPRRLMVLPPGTASSMVVLSLFAARLEENAIVLPRKELGGRDRMMKSMCLALRERLLCTDPLALSRSARPLRSSSVPSRPQTPRTAIAATTFGLAELALSL